MSSPATRRGRRGPRPAAAPDPSPAEPPGGRAGSARPPARPVTAQRYRRRRVAALVVVLVALVGLGVGVRVLLYDLGWFDVTEVTVAGAAAVPTAAVLDAAGVAQGTPLIAVDTAAAAVRVAALPGVATATVGRGWPHTVAVTVTERVPVATTTTGAGPALIDTDGVVYGGPDSPWLAAAAPPGLPALLVRGTAGDESTARDGIAVLRGLPPELTGQVSAVDVDAAPPGVPGQVSLELVDGRSVRWGNSERGQEKAAVLMALLTQRGTVYDVSSPDLPTVRR